jgi:hypothetical protein
MHAHVLPFGLVNHARFKAFDLGHYGGTFPGQVRVVGFFWGENVHEFNVGDESREVFD